MELMGQLADGRSLLAVHKDDARAVRDALNTLADVLDMPIAPAAASVPDYRPPDPPEVEDAAPPPDANPPARATKPRKRATRKPKAATKRPKREPAAKPRSGAVKPPVERKGRIPWARLITDELAAAGKPLSVADLAERLQGKPELKRIERLKHRLGVNIAGQPNRFRRVSLGVYALVETDQPPAPPKQTPKVGQVEQLFRRDPSELTKDELRERLDYAQKLHRPDEAGRREFIRRCSQ